MVGREPPEEVRALEMIEVGLDGVVADAQARSELARVQELPLQRGEHPHHALDELRACGKAPSGEVPLREQGHIVELHARGPAPPTR